MSKFEFEECRVKPQTITICYDPEQMKREWRPLFRKIVDERRQLIIKHRLPEYYLLAPSSEIKRSIHDYKASNWIKRAKLLRSA